ncbi:Alkaline phosphatase D precursor [Corynebacterium occultum]|uniref:Alkaline phosphatase D n=1 Tax=Corynebacterium occultum TaxID=2675219 RepID=A0A6B8WCG3_9CORY|nr:Alkaline phosphatase D precursor [Corynebacterium occultum]
MTAAVPLVWEVTTTPEFGETITRGEVTATTATDHTSQVEVWGLQPTQVYYFRFVVTTRDLTGR